MSYLDFLQLSPGLAVHVQVAKSLYIYACISVSVDQRADLVLTTLYQSLCYPSSIVPGDTWVVLLYAVHCSGTYSKRNVLVAL